MDFPSNNLACIHLSYPYRRVRLERLREDLLKKVVNVLDSSSPTVPPAKVMGRRMLPFYFKPDRKLVYHL